MRQYRIRPADVEGKSWLTPQEAAACYGIGMTRLYGLLRTGELPSAKLGRTRHIRRTDIETYFESLLNICA